MSKIADALKKLQENPDDLSTLPQLIAQVETIENSEADYQDRIQKLQEINRNYLAQIPVPSDDPKTGQDDETNDEPTFDDARDYIIQSLGGND